MKLLSSYCFLINRELFSNFLLLPFRVLEVEQRNDTNQYAISDFYGPYKCDVGTNDRGEQPRLERVENKDKTLKDEGVCGVPCSGNGLEERDPETETEGCETDHVKRRDGCCNQFATIGVDGQHVMWEYVAYEQNGNDT